MVEINGDIIYKEKLPKHIRKHIKKKHNSWKRYLETRLAQKHKVFCRARNKVKNTIKYFRKQKEKGISKNIKSNPKAFWKYIKSKTSMKCNITNLHKDPLDEKSPLTDNNQEKANIMNEYFSTVFTKEPNGHIPTLEPRSRTEQPFIEILQENVNLLLKDLKISKSPGPDGLHPRFLKELCEQLCIPLTLIFQSSIQLNEIPKQWKLARVSAIHKKGNTTLAMNYRPVSITSIVCRVMETIIRDQITSFLVKNKLLSSFQFGFLKGRSTTLQLLNVLNDWTESMENKNNVDCLWIIKRHLTQCHI